MVLGRSSCREHIYSGLERNLIIFRSIDKVHIGVTAHIPGAEPHGESHRLLSVRLDGGLVCKHS